jgi:uncharacterized protein YbaA (DUF1428 family)
MPEYVDGFVIPVPKKKIADYRRIAKIASKVWRDHGAVDYRECVSDDVSWGKSTSFPRSVKLKPSEVVVFSYIVHKSRAARERTNARAMKDPRITRMDPKKMPFDGRRMFWGGFGTIVK